MDETTTALSQEGRDELYKHMDRIRNSGNSVIFISHDLPEVLEKSDTITILRDGIYIDTVKSADVTEDDLKRLMVGREVTGDYYRADYGEKVSDEVVLSVKNVTVPGIISDISFDLRRIVRIRNARGRKSDFRRILRQRGHGDAGGRNTDQRYSDSNQAQHCLHVQGS